jgi:hypothetical protein
LALQDYAQLKGFYNGSPITQITSLGIQTESGIIRVELMEGLGGFSSGSGAVSIEVGFSVPIGGMEFEFQQDCANEAYVDFQVFIGRHSYAGRGKLESVNITGSTGSATEGTFTWTGEIKPFE